MSFFSFTSEKLAKAKRLLSAPFKRATKAVKDAQQTESAAEIDHKLCQPHPNVLLRRAMKAEIKRRGLSGSERRQFRKNFQASLRVAPDAVTGRLMLTRK